MFVLVPDARGVGKVGDEGRGLEFVGFMAPETERVLVVLVAVLLKESTEWIQNWRL